MSDPDKPDCPYLPGFEIDISTHAAPRPFGSSIYPPDLYSWRSDKWLRSVTQTTHVLTYPPLETPAPGQLSTARLIVTKSIAIGNARGPQVLLCSITPERAKAFEAVAKIYDPLYYPPLSDIGSYPSDVVGHADADYSREAAAYECLTRAGKSSFAPAFFGSWTFSLPTPYKQQTYRRNVRLVLVEYIPGISMKDLFVKNGPNQINALHLSKEYRLRVVAMLLDGVVQQHHAGVNQRDLAPRNIIIVPPPNLTEIFPKRVALIDYNISAVYKMTKYPSKPGQPAKLPPNPMKHFWTSTIPDLAGWAPLGMCHNGRLWQEWLRSEFGGEKKVLYEPLAEELELEDPRPEEVAVLQDPYR